jgi:hypothetical protein
MIGGIAATATRAGAAGYLLPAGVSASRGIGLAMQNGHAGSPDPPRREL